MAFAKGQSLDFLTPKVVSFNMNSGQVLWTYEGSRVDPVRFNLLAATDDSGILIGDAHFAAGRVLYTRLVNVDSLGVPVEVANMFINAPPTYSWSGQWHVGGAAIVLPVAVDAANLWATPRGNPSGSGFGTALCDCLIQSTNPPPPLAPALTLAEPAAPLVCPICDLPPPVTPATSCTTFPGTQSKYVILVGDSGLNAPGRSHNVGNLFNLAAQTQANSLQSQGQNVIGCRVSSIQDVYYALTKNGTIDGGVYYFGHSGPRQTIDPITKAVITQTSELFVGQAAGPDTNISAQNVIYLRPIQTANAGGHMMGPNAAMRINGCTAGLTIYDTTFAGYTSIAQLISNNIARGVYAYAVGMYFSQSDAQGDQNTNGVKLYPPNALPMYMVPEGAPRRKPGPVPFTPR